VAVERPADKNDLWTEAEGHHRRGNLDEAVAVYRRIIGQAGPDAVRAWANMGVAQRAKGDCLAAIDCYRHALDIEPGNPTFLGNLGNALIDIGRSEESLAAHAAAVKARPDDVGKLTNYGIALKQAGRTEAALAVLERACNLDPQHAKAQWNRALALLRLGRYEDGWPAFEWRWRIGKMELQYTDTPRWWGERFDGKTLLIYPEQGFGDAIQCSRFIPLARERGGRIVLVCERPLQRLFAGLPGVDQLVAAGTALAHHDLQCPIMSLPAVLDVELGSLPPPAELRIPQAANDKAKQWLRGAAPRIGLVWSGSPTHRNDRNRSVVLDRLAPLLELGVTVVSLQKEIAPEDRQRLACYGNCLHLGDGLDDFADTAAAVSLMDVVVSVDTSVAHLAGTLGKPVWIMLPFLDTDWRWLAERDDSPWYPTARLFRQPAHGDWNSVVARICSELRRTMMTDHRAG